MGRTFYGYWACQYCDSEHRGDITICPSCGHPRGDSVKFYPNPQKKQESRQYIQVHHDSSPNWQCSYCESMVPAEESLCPSCGHPRSQSDKDYFGLHPERLNIMLKGCDFDD